MEEVPLLWRHTLDPSIGKMRRIVYAHQTCKIPALAHGFVDAIRDLLSFIPLRDIRFNFGLHPLTDFGAKSGMRFIEIGRVILQP